jgi:hypothetical protein
MSDARSAIGENLIEEKVKMTVKMKCTPSWDDVWDDFGKWRWLKSYNPEAHAGRGAVKFTDDVDEAMTFPDRRSAFACYLQVPKNHPVRDDGKPNRPLTAYTVEID